MRINWGRKSDFMDSFIELKGEFSTTVDDNMGIGYMLTNVVALRDTTASTMCLAVYYILKLPQWAKDFAKSFELRARACLRSGRRYSLPLP
ncbi:benzoate 4-monooxygenase cytochrome P450 [Penicillium malachiteum]|uniref:benzoate 4-monooxygenase cytochrome P450 n=1 Tax=Penicillium malachiteum TaxID=1324776 RepID=UPI002547C696|nr:benzoate 4-monooxygenase cytochrome P450 [Penicillium malachiteum]KAJ5726584.1 benzoate 4-monooxygenase cytochrome P450 [Penicillium malachiteum]